ncbi:MAG TPA: YihY/virulence factor BrkB family protein [Pilimelia sp.]|nr:YihY/virulence factor BrkB family protein [Pilimelia sp.]
MSTLDRIEAAFDAAVTSARARSKLFDRLWAARERFEGVLGSRLAAAISYYAFFAAFALALLAYSILGFFLRYNLDVYAVVDEFLEQNLPWLEPATIEGNKGKVGFIGLVGLIFTGVGWVEAIRSSVRQIFCVEQQPGNPIVRWLVDLAVLAGLFALLGLSLTAAYGLEWLLEQLTGGRSIMMTVVGWVISVLLNVVLVAALINGVPRLRLPVRQQITPVLVVALGITVLNSLGQALIGRVSGNPAYAVVAGAVGLLLYLYLFNQMILYGAAFIATSPFAEPLDPVAGASGASGSSSAFGASGDDGTRGVDPAAARGA